MQKKNQLLRIGSILMILGAAMAMLMAMATASTLDMGMSTVNSLTQDPAFMADLEATGMTLDQVLAAAKNLLTAVMGMMAVFNVIKIVVGALGLRKLQSGTVYFTGWGIAFLVFGVLGLLIFGVSNLMGIANLLGGLAGPVLYIVGGAQNKKALQAAAQSEEE